MLIGREREIARLHERFAQALQGERQVVFLSGEAGIGKTTLVDAFVEQVQAKTSLWIGRGQCVEHYGAGEAYLPLLEALGRLGRTPAGEPLVTALRHQAPSWLVHLPALGIIRVCRFVAHRPHQQVQPLIPREPISRGHVCLHVPVGELDGPDAIDEKWPVLSFEDERIVVAERNLGPHSPHQQPIMLVDRPVIDVDVVQV